MATGRERLAVDRPHDQDVRLAPAMGDTLLRAYHRLPAPLRSVAATLRGHYLRSWRYGPETARLIEEARDREQWSADRWRVWREERLARVLRHAATRVPYYRAQWEARRRAGDRRSWEVLANWPILEKETVRERAIELVGDDRNVKRMFHEHTSGTTGTSLDLWWSQAAVRGWYALFEARCRHWYDVSRHDRWAMLAGQLVTPITQRRPPFWVWNEALNQLYMSSYHLAPAFLPSYVDALRAHRITHLSGYTSAIVSLAQEVIRQRRRDLKMGVAITNAEPVLEHQRALIEQAFDCPVCETYGQTEIVACASQCRDGSLHTWPEVGVMEIVNEHLAAPPGTSGDVIGTSLLNPDMPLIRYRLGDRATMARTDSCGCGRTLPMLEQIDGRIDDVLYTRDGRRIGRLDPVFKTQLPVREAQIIQETLDRVRIKFVPAPDYTDAAGASIADRVRDRLGQVDVVLEPVSTIPRTSRGKFRAVICALPPAERERLSSTASPN